MSIMTEILKMKKMASYMRVELHSIELNPDEVKELAGYIRRLAVVEFGAEDKIDYMAHHGIIKGSIKVFGMKVTSVRKETL